MGAKDMKDADVVAAADVAAAIMVEVVGPARTDACFEFYYSDNASPTPNALRCVADGKDLLVTDSCKPEECSMLGLILSRLLIDARAKK